MTTSKRFRVRDRKPVATAEGRMYGPGEVITGIDTKRPDNKRLLERGRIEEIVSRRRRTTRRRSTTSSSRSSAASAASAPKNKSSQGSEPAKSEEASK